MTKLKTNVFTGLGVSLVDSKDYQPQEVFDILSSLKKAAEEKGFSNCVLRFNSTMEPYEDYPGDPEVSIYGDRPYTKTELQTIESEKVITSLAEEKGLTIFEARQLKHLRDKGVV